MANEKGPNVKKTQKCKNCEGKGLLKKGDRVVKCQRCYHSLAVERPALEDNWPPFRSATYDWDASPSEGGGPG